MPEMLWESSDAAAELRTRFGFSSADAAAAWAVRLLADEYGVRAVTIDRMVISWHNLMIWTTTETAVRLMVKVCRLTEAHDSLSVRGALVRWLADRELPVAAPVLAHGGDHQMLRNGCSIGVQPLLPGELLDAGDHDLVRAAGSALGTLHAELAAWPDAALLEHAQPVAAVRGDLWGFAPGRAETVPAELRRRLEQRIVDLPELPRQPVHSDFRGANVLFHEGSISGILDFEDARIDAAVVDLAQSVCLLGTWYRDWQPISPEAQTLFIDGYRERRPLSEAERAWLPPLIAWSMLGQGWSDDAERWLA